MSEKKICGHCLNYGERGKCRIPSKDDNLPFFAPACADEYQEKPQTTKPAKKMSKTSTYTIQGSDPNLRVCSECGKRLPLSCFPKMGRGHSFVCEECKEKAKGAKASRDSNPDQAGTKPGPSRDQVGTKPALSTEVQAQLDAERFAEAEKHRKEAVRMALQMATIDEITAELKRRGLSGSLTLKY